jgi:hypothetical protein
VVPWLVLASALTAGAAQGTATTAAPPNGVVLRADAGLGGFVRSGRWTPVRIRIDSEQRDLRGTVVLEWGDARMRRAIDIPARSRIDIELYTRTTDARGSIAVRVMSNEALVTSTDVPVRVVPNENVLVVCAGTAVVGAGKEPCTTSIAPEALPRSMRGYVGADDVRVQPGAESRLTPAQRSALARWRALHDRDSSFIATPPRAPLNASRPAGVGRSTIVAACVVMGAAIAFAAMWTLSRGPAWRSYAALAVATALGTAAAIFAGRFGPGAEILVHHATTVEQVGDGATVTMRGTIEYPSYSDYTIRLAGLDGDVMRRAINGSTQWLDVDGAPILRGTFGRDRTEQVELDGVADYAPFRVHREGDVVRVSNVSNDVLSDCSFTEGFSEGRIGTLAPAQTAAARATGAADSSFFSCAAPVTPVRFSESHFAVTLKGVAIVSVRLPERSPQRPAVSE